MKLILSSALLAMISAGIYGVVDFSKDVSNGTLIDYRHNLHLARFLKGRGFFSTHGSDAIRQTIALNAKKKEEADRKKKQQELLEQQENYSIMNFSREEPPMSPDELRSLELEQLQQDSL
ncbi:MAG TPA: hypothetical protein VI112_00900, partial [Bacteroidia bacterium]